MAIRKNQFVKLTYKLYDTNAEGDLLDETLDSEPLTFIFGVGHMIPIFEENLESKSQGDHFAFVVDAEDAYGLYDDKAIAEIPLPQLEKDGKVDREAIAAGQPLKFQDQEGLEYNGIIMEVNEETAKVDFNHPMAGYDLFFKGDIQEVRDVTEEELKNEHILE